MNESPWHEPTLNLNADAQPPSCTDATVDAPPSELLPDESAQSSSCIDATIDTPPASTPQLSSGDGATIDLPREMPDASLFTMDHQPTQKSVGSSSESDGDSFDLSEDSCQVRDETKTLIANYEVLGVLGRGAVGVVYKARQIGLNRLVALKMLLAGSHAGPRELARFRIEAEAVARLRHPNIVQVYEVGEHNGLPFFSLEFVEGGSLHQKMGGKPLPARNAAEIQEALTRAMHYAHQQNILHRDLKPANILVAPDGTPKITDFGLAKRLEETEESSQTRTGTLMGTPSYMSPEQAEGRTHDIGPLSDQYTLGAILYEMLTGRPPFLGATLLDTIQQVRTQEPVPPTQLQATTPRDLEVICLKSLQKEPAKRYSDAGEMADDLRRFLSGEPILARPVSQTERLWRWCRRNPRLASLYAAVFLLVLLVAGSSGILGIRLLHEKQTVDRVRDQAEERLQQATDDISGGDFRRAKALLLWNSPLLESSSDLREQHERWKSLKGSIESYEQFKDLLDKARFAYLYQGSNKKQREQGGEHCRQLLGLYEAIEQGRTALPPLNAEQKQLFNEDIFDMFLIAALTENELNLDADSVQRQKAWQQALDWLDRAEKKLPQTRTIYAHRSGFYKNLGNWEAAFDNFKRARAIQPTAALDHFWHGYAEHLRGQGDDSRGYPEKAEEHYRQEVAEYAALLQQHPDHFWGYFSWAVAKAQLNDLEDALIGFTACIRLRPNFSWPYHNRGTVHLRLQQYNEALRDYDAALERDPEAVSARTDLALLYLEMDRVDEALNECDRVLKQSPDHAQAYLNRAESYRRRKQYEDALADCTRILELNKQKDAVHRKRAAIYEDLTNAGDLPRIKHVRDLDHKKAIEIYKQALKSFTSKEYVQALGKFTAAIELYPQLAGPYHDRAVLNWLYLKDFDAALIDSRKAAEVWAVIPSYAKRPAPYRYLGTIHLGRRQYDLALQELDEALSRRPDYADVLWAKAQIYLWQEKTKEALDCLAPLIKKLPAGDATVLNIHGDINRSLGRLDAAADDYGRLIQLRPEVPETYVSLALVYDKQGKQAEARRCLDQLVEANPKMAAAYLRRGRFLRDRGQFEEAWKDSEQAARCDAISVLPALLQASITAARGDPAAAVAAAELALFRAQEDKVKDNGHVLYSATQVWALASTAAARAGDDQAAQQYSDRAVELLTQTLDKGFHDLNFPDHNRMIDDPALESIRQHPKARNLLAHRG